MYFEMSNRNTHMSCNLDSRIGIYLCLYLLFICVCKILFSNINKYYVFFIGKKKCIHLYIQVNKLAGFYKPLFLVLLEATIMLLI